MLPWSSASMWRGVRPGPRRASSLGSRRAPLRKARVFVSSPPHLVNQRRLEPRKHGVSVRLLVIGAGGVGSAIAAIAGRRSAFERMTVADIDRARADTAVPRPHPARLLPSPGAPPDP